MDPKDFLTNEKVCKKFKSQFELVNYAISLASNMIQSGRESRVKTESQNKAMQVLTEILQDKDQFDDIVIPEANQNQDIKYYHSQNEPSSSKSTERKKSRKILGE